MLPLVLFMLLYFTPVRAYLNAHNTHPKECTIQSVKTVKSGSGRKVASGKNYVRVETSDCGSIAVKKDTHDNWDAQAIADSLSQKVGQKVTFMVGPMAWNFGSTDATSVKLD